MNKYITINAFLNYCKDKNIISLQQSIRMKKEITKFKHEDREMDGYFDERIERIEEILRKSFNK